MARLSDLGEWERELMLIKLKDLHPLGGAPWVAGPALNKRRVALVTSAGIHRSDDQPFRDLVITKIPFIMSSSSTNGVAAYEDAHAGTQWCIDRDGGFGRAAG